MRAWRFTYPADTDRMAHGAVRSAASFIQHKRASFADSLVPRTPTGIAVMAVKVYPVFLDTGIHAKGDSEIAHTVIQANRTFDAGA